MLKRWFTPDSIVWFLTACLLIAIPLMQKFPLISVPGTFVAIRTEDLLLLIGAYVSSIYLYKSIKKFEIHPVVKAFFIYSVIGFVSVVSAVFITQTVLPHIGFLHWARRIEYFTAFIVGYLYIHNTKDVSARVKFVINCLIVVMFFVFIYGAGQRYLSFPVIITQNEEYSKGVALRWVTGSHINSTFAGHYDLSTYLVLVLPILVTLFFISERLKTKVIVFISWCMGMWLMVNAASRISLVGYLLSIIVALLLVKRYKAILITLIASIAFVGLSSNLIDRYIRVIEFAAQKVSQTILPPVYAEVEILGVEDSTRVRTLTITPSPTPVFEDRSTNIRLAVEWPRAIRAFVKNPLLGTGFSSITLATDNDYLRALGESGLLGALTFFVIVFGTVYLFYIQSIQLNKLIPTFKFNNASVEVTAVVVGIIAAQIGILVNALFIDIFEASKLMISYWLFTGITIALIEKLKKEAI
jgi:O-Antigen ligase